MTYSAGRRLWNRVSVSTIMMIAAALPALLNAQAARCNCPYREHTRTPTPEVVRLFEAAESADKSCAMPSSSRRGRYRTGTTSKQR